MWPLRAAIFLLCCSGCWCCSLSRAYVKSKNFFSVLHWDAVDIPGQTVIYSVQYNTYGTLYHPVTWCQNISAPVCDLTDVISLVLTDVSLRYHARITVSGQCVGDVRFTPFRQTTLAAPQLSVASNKTHLNVTVSPPMLPWNRSIENIRAWLGVKYTVHLTHPKSVAGKVFKGTSRSVFIWIVETDVQYCGDVAYTLTHPGWSNHSESTSFCVNVSDPDSRFHILLWPGLLALLLLIILPITLCQLFVKRKRSLPKVLLSKCTSPPVCSYPRDDISKLEVCCGSPFPKNPDIIFAQHKSEIMNSYAPQEPYRCQQDVPVHDSAESSVHYSLVQISNEPSSDGKSDETSPDSLSSESVLSISDTERSSETLVVPVRPTENGALQFHDGLFQFDTDLSSPAAAEDSEGLTGELAPLLTDLVQTASRCNSVYLPVHVSDSVTSNYRQNWLPGTPLEGKQDQRTYILRTDH